MRPLTAPYLPRLLTNTGWNLAGQVVPLLVGLAVLPLLIRLLGLDRYGFLTLVWVLVGYASIFDFGISNVLVRLVAARVARGDVQGAHHVGRVGISYLTFFGLLVAVAFATSSGWLVAHVFKLPPELLGEARHAMWLLAASIPLVMITSGYVGVISAHQKFRGLNLLRAALGIGSYLGPLLVAAWLKRLDALVAVTLALRVASAGAHAVLARRSCGFRSGLRVPDAATSRELFSIGGWVAVSNFISPMLSYLDRLLLGALVPVRMVAYYATPFDLMSRTTILPSSMMAALFPSVAAVHPGSEAARQMLVTASRLLYVSMLPVVFVAMVLAHPALQIWLGTDFATYAAPVLQILAIGFFANTLAQAPAMLIQAAGQPKVMALLHLVELPVFVGVLYLLTSRFGIVGTALAAALRNVFDGLLVLLLARRDVARGAVHWAGALSPTLFAVALLLCAAWPWTAAQAMVVLVCGLAVFAAFSWRVVLSPSERTRLLAFAKSST